MPVAGRLYELLIDVHSFSSVAIVALEGRLTSPQAQCLRRCLEREVARGRHILVVDFRGLSVLDCSGLAAVIWVLKLTRMAGGDLRLARLNDQALRLVTMTGLHHVLRIHDTIESALAACRT